MIQVKVEISEMFLNKKNLFLKLPVALVFCLVVFSTKTSAQAPADSLLNSFVKHAVLNKNPKELTHFFHAKVDLVLLDDHGIYSKDQAQVLLAVFFEQHVPLSFELLSQNKNAKSNFVICTLQTATKQFRVCYLVKTELNQNTIYQFRIEE